MNLSFFDIIWYILWHPSLIFLHLVNFFFWVITEAIVVVVVAAAAAAARVNVNINKTYIFFTLYLSLMHMLKD